MCTFTAFTFLTLHRGGTDVTQCTEIRSETVVIKTQRAKITSVVNVKKTRGCHRPWLHSGPVYHGFNWQTVYDFAVLVLSFTKIGPCERKTMFPKLNLEFWERKSWSAKQASETKDKNVTNTGFWHFSHNSDFVLKMQTLISHFCFYQWHKMKKKKKKLCLNWADF